MSSSGQYQTAVASTKLFISSDSGATWTLVTLPTLPRNALFKSNTMSSSGQYQSLVVYGNGLAPGSIYVSNDYGVTWTAVPNISDENLYGVSMSGTGEYQTAVSFATGQNCYISTNYGVSWNPVTTTVMSPYSLTAVAVSDTGAYQTVNAFGGGGIWVSIDSNLI